jgi:hypothetical protein
MRQRGYELQVGQPQVNHQRNWMAIKCESNGTTTHGDGSGGIFKSRYWLCFQKKRRSYFFIETISDRVTSRFYVPSAGIIGIAESSADGHRRRRAIMSHSFCGLSALERRSSRKEDTPEVPWLPWEYRNIFFMPFRQTSGSTVLSLSNPGRTSLCEGQVIGRTYPSGMTRVIQCVVKQKN